MARGRGGARSPVARTGPPLTRGGGDGSYCRGARREAAAVGTGATAQIRRHAGRVLALPRRRRSGAECGIARRRLCRGRRVPDGAGRRGSRTPAGPVRGPARGPRDRQAAGSAAPGVRRGRPRAGRQERPGPPADHRRAHGRPGRTLPGRDAHRGPAEGCGDAADHEGTGRADPGFPGGADRRDRGAPAPVPGTVRNYMATAVRKVGARNRVDAIRIVQSAGWT